MGSVNASPHNNMKERFFGFLCLQLLINLVCFSTSPPLRTPFSGIPMLCDSTFGGCISPIIFP